MKKILTSLLLLLLAFTIMAEERTHKLTITIVYDSITLKDAVAVEKKIDKMFKEDTTATVSVKFWDSVPATELYPKWQHFYNKNNNNMLLTY